MSTITSPIDIADNSPVTPLKPKDFKGKVDPDWCAGCGDFSVLACLQKVCVELGFEPHEIITVSGIGCSSNFPGYFNAYGMHTLHGRTLAVASGVKLGNHSMNVIATGGDGDAETDSTAPITLNLCSPGLIFVLGVVLSALTAGRIRRRRRAV